MSPAIVAVIFANVINVCFLILVNIYSTIAIDSISMYICIKMEIYWSCICRYRCNINNIYSVVISYYILAFALLGWMKWKKLHEKTWFGWSKESLKGWGEYMKLGFPGALMVMLVVFRTISIMKQEWGSFEIVAIGIGLLHDSSILAAHAVIANTVAFCFMVPLGISIGTILLLSEVITKSCFHKSRKLLRSRTTRCSKKEFYDLYDVGR